MSPPEETTTSWPARCAARISGTIGSRCPYAGQEPKRTLIGSRSRLEHEDVDIVQRQPDGRVVGVGEQVLQRAAAHRPDPAERADPVHGDLELVDRLTGPVR